MAWRLNRFGTTMSGLRIRMCRSLVPRPTRMISQRDVTLFLLGYSALIAFILVLAFLYWFRLALFILDFTLSFKNSAHDVALSSVRTSLRTSAPKQALQGISLNHEEVKHKLRTMLILAKAAMTESLAPDHVPTENLLKVYSKWADGGWGMILTGRVHHSSFSVVHVQLMKA